MNLILECLLIIYDVTYMSLTPTKAHVEEQQLQQKHQKHQPQQQQHEQVKLFSVHTLKYNGT